MHSTLTKIEDDPKAEISLLEKIKSENLLYKETLEKNNLIMKEQLSVFCTLKDKMMLEMQEQQQVLQEAVGKIFFLKEENSILQKKLDSLSEDMNQSKRIKDFGTKEESVKERSQISSDTCKELADHKKIIQEKGEEINLIHRKDLMSALKSAQDEIKRLNKEVKKYQQMFDSSSRHESLQQTDKYEVDRSKMSENHNTNELGLESHNIMENLKMEQGNQRDKNSSPSSSRKNVSCPSLTKSHRNGGKPIVCPICGDEFSNKLTANNHMNYYHIMS